MKFVTTKAKSNTKLGEWAKNVHILDSSIFLGVQLSWADPNIRDETQLYMYHSTINRLPGDKYCRSLHSAVGLCPMSP